MLRWTTAPECVGELLFLRGVREGVGILGGVGVESLGECTGSRGEEGVGIPGGVGVESLGECAGSRGEEGVGIPGGVGVESLGECAGSRGEEGAGGCTKGISTSAEASGVGRTDGALI
jgi:hypothetical protein